MPTITNKPVPNCGGDQNDDDGTNQNEKYDEFEETSEDDDFDDFSGMPS